MLVIGVLLILAAVVLGAVGLIGTGLKVLLWVGIALLVVGVVLAVLDRTRGPRSPV